MAKIIERIYPYFIAFCFTALWFIYGHNLSNSLGFNNALDSTSTLCSILLGFVSAILPVVLSMRNKGNYIDNVIINGGYLLKSYCAEDIISGLTLIVINIINYFRCDINEKVSYFLFYIWIFGLITFILCTHRCIYFLLRLVFPKEIIDAIPEESEAEKLYKTKQ